MAHRNFARAMRRKTQWAGFGAAAATPTLPIMVSLTAGTPAIISTGGVIAGVFGFLDEEVTLTRTIGTISAFMRVNTAVTFATVAVGCIVVRGEAEAAGVAALPSPEDDPDAEWLYYDVFHIGNPQNALRDGPLSAVSRRFDVRGQRIVRAGSNVLWIAESETTDVSVGVAGRYLAKFT